MDILNRFGIGKYFITLWSSADFGKIKPCKEFFDLAVQTALSDNPSSMKDDIVFVGDMYETDVIGAHNAGIKSAWLNKNGVPDLNGLATYNCGSVEQLFDVIGG